MSDCIGRDVIVSMARTHYQDPAGFHEVVCAYLGVEEEEYAVEANTLPVHLLATIERHKAHVESASAGAPIDDEVLTALISASRKLDAWRRLAHDHDENVIVDRARAWLKANDLPTEYGR